MTAELVDDGFAAAFWEIDLDAKPETLFRNENGRIMIIFFENTKSPKIGVFVKDFALGDAFFINFVFDFARRTESEDENSDDANDD